MPLDKKRQQNVSKLFFQTVRSQSGRQDSNLRPSATKSLGLMCRLAFLAAASLGLGIAVIVDQPAAFMGHSVPVHNSTYAQ